MKKVLNNNALKIIAGISMLIDHVGLILFPNIIWLRVIGRIAFPIFAFCIAEGLHYTKNRKKYIILLLIFAMISQVPYYFIFKTFLFFNVLFTFLIAILCIILVEELKSSNNSNIKTILLQVSLVVIMLGLIVITPLRVMEYGIFGVLTTIIFYFLM